MQVQTLERWTSLAAGEIEEGHDMITRAWQRERDGGVACREGGRRKRVLEARPAEHSASSTSESQTDKLQGAAATSSPHVQQNRCLRWCTEYGRATRQQTHVSLVSSSSH